MVTQPVDWGALKAKLIQERGCRCESCGKLAMESELQMHHAVYGRKKHHPEYDCAENVELLCAGCHKPGQLGYAHRQAFWDRQIARGYDMTGWIESLCLKVKHL